MKTVNQSWITLSCLQLSGTLSLPVIMVGFYLGQHYVLEDCLLQIIVGNILLFIVSLFYMRVIHQKKMVTIEFAQCLFGTRGSLICAFSMALSLIGWSAIQINLISSTLGNPFILNVLIAVGIYFLTRKELGYLAAINKLLLPCTMLCLVYLLIITPKTISNSEMLSVEPFKLGLMLAITTGSGLVFDLPTFYCHAATRKDAIVSLALIFLVFLPAIQGLGVYLGIHYMPISHNTNWIASFIAGFNLSSILFLLLSGMLGACLNLYSTSIIMSRSFGISYRKVLLLSCLLSAALAQINLEKHFSTFLEIINLNAEVLAALTFMYISFKGISLPLPNSQQRKIHLCIFGVVLTYASFSTFCHLSFSQDLFLDTTLLSCLLMLTYYLPTVILEKKYEFSQRK